MSLCGGICLSVIRRIMEGSEVCLWWCSWLCDGCCDPDRCASYIPRDVKVEVEASIGKQLTMFNI